MKKIEKLLAEQEKIKSALKIPHAVIIRDMKRGKTLGISVDGCLAWDKTVETAKRILELEEVK